MRTAAAADTPAELQLVPLTCNIAPPLVSYHVYVELEGPLLSTDLFGAAVELKGSRGRSGWTDLEPAELADSPFGAAPPTVSAHLFAMRLVDVGDAEVLVLHITPSSPMPSAFLLCARIAAVGADSFLSLPYFDWLRSPSGGTAYVYACAWTRLLDTRVDLCVDMCGRHVLVPYFDWLQLLSVLCTLSADMLRLRIHTSLPMCPHTHVFSHVRSHVCAQTRLPST